MSRIDATWSSERLEALQRCFEAGLSCSQIASEIGLTRNAVIGKLNRLGLSRPKDAISRQLKGIRTARPMRLSQPSRRTIFNQHEVLKAVFSEPQLYEEIPIRDGRGCTLLELGLQKCRWPISTPGAADFCFCGNESVKGLPYCPGHARLAYRPARVRSA